MKCYEAMAIQADAEHSIWRVIVTEIFRVLQLFVVPNKSIHKCKLRLQVIKTGEV